MTEEPVLVGYKAGHSEPDQAFFFAPYWPGMTEEQKKRVDWELAQRSKTPTAIQEFIMKQASTRKDIRE